MKNSELKLYRIQTETSMLELYLTYFLDDDLMTHLLTVK